MIENRDAAVVSLNVLYLVAWRSWLTDICIKLSLPQTPPVVQRRHTAAKLQLLHCESQLSLAQLFGFEQVFTLLNGLIESKRDFVEGELPVNY